MLFQTYSRLFTDTFQNCDGMEIHLHHGIYPNKQSSTSRQIILHYDKNDQLYYCSREWNDMKAEWYLKDEVDYFHYGKTKELTKAPWKFGTKDEAYRVIQLFTKRLQGHMANVPDHVHECLAAVINSILGTTPENAIREEFFYRSGNQLDITPNLGFGLLLSVYTLTANWDGKEFMATYSISSPAVGREHFTMGYRPIKQAKIRDPRVHRKIEGLEDLLDKEDLFV